MGTWSIACMNVSQSDVRYMCDVLESALSRPNSRGDNDHASVKSEGDS